MYNVYAPDRVFLDIYMPVMDGIETLEQIMASDPLAKGVMFSSLSNQSMLDKAMEFGSKGFVAKPFTEEALLQYARKLLTADWQAKLSVGGFGVGASGA